MRRSPASSRRARAPQPQPRPRARPAALLLALVARATHFLFHDLLAALKRQFSTWRRELVDALTPVGGRMRFEPLEPRLLMSADVATLLAPPPADTQTDPSTDPSTDASTQREQSRALSAAALALQATVSVSGAGSAQLVQAGDGSYTLALSGTDAASRVTLATTGGPGHVLLTGITSSSAIGTLDLALADLQGSARLDGAVTNLTLGHLTNASLELAGASSTLRLGQVDNSSVLAGQTALRVQADAWTGGSSRLVAATLMQLNVAGAFDAALTVGTPGASATVLTGVTIGGSATGAWDIAGRTGAVQIGSTSPSWRAIFGGAVTQLYIVGDAAGTVVASAIGVLQVGGSMRGMTVLVGADLGADRALGGTGANADTFKAGTLARLRVGGDMVDSRVHAGVDPSTAAVLGGSANRLQELLVGGQLAGSTRVVAPQFPPTVRVGGATVAPGALPQLQVVASDTTAPLLGAALQSDSGASASDGITNAAALLLQASDALGVTGFEARIDAGPNAAYTAITPTAVSGGYLLNAAALAQLAGGALAQGAHVVELRAIDAAGNRSALARVAFTLDTTAPVATVQLAPASDTGTLGDNATTLATVTLLGNTSAGASVQLGGTSTTADGSGNFSFSSVPLALGGNSFSFTLTDVAGNTGSASLAVQRTAVPPTDTTLPTVDTLALVADTGSSASDSVTRDPRIQGTVSDNVGVTQLLVALDPAATPVYTDLSAALTGGSFSLSAAQLNTLAGGTLGQGAHSLSVVAVDAAGNRSTARTLAFTLDTVAPTATVALDPASDTGTAGDGQTTLSSATLVGTTSPGATVQLGAASTTANSTTGAFSFANVALTLGANAFSFTLTDAAGNTGSASLTVQRVVVPPTDTTLPTVDTLALVADTGSSTTDGITRDARIQGTVSDNVAVTQLLVALDAATEVDLTSTLTAGSFSLSATQLNTLAGGALGQGSHSLSVVAVDAAGNRSLARTLARTLAFTLDTVAPTATVALDPASDTGTAGDGQTTLASVTLVGTTSPGTAVEFGSASMTADDTTGAFAFNGVALNVGANPFSFSLTDAAGNTGSASLTVQRVVVPPTDTTLPTVDTLALVADTGSSASDGVTRDPRIAGTVSDNVGVTQLLIALDAATEVDLTSALVSGSFSLSATQLNTLAGGTLGQGAHSLSVVAVDAAGNRSLARNLAFTLDSIAPTGTAALAAASDTGTVGDLITESANVTLQGTTGPGVSVQLGSASMTADATTGAFAFNGVPLTLGANAFTFTLTDAAGNTGTVNLSVQRNAPTSVDGQAPVVAMALVNDSGRSGSDGITNDARVAGTAIDNVATTRLLVALDPGATPTFTDLSVALANGAFSITAAQLASLAGGTLAQGAHTLRVVAEDAAGNRSAAVNLSFTLDSVAPTGGSFGIAITDALGGDTARTDDAIAVLAGTVEANASVTLGAQGLSVVASGTGAFTMPGVDLALGTTTVTLGVLDAAGNSTSITRTITRVAPTTSADPVLAWNQIALQSIQRDVTTPEEATRILAMQSVAVYDTLAAIEGSAAFMVQDSVTGPVSVQAAVAQAAYQILHAFYPSQRTVLDAALASSLAAVTDGAAKTAGIALGERVAKAIVVIRANDGYLDYAIDDGGTAIGQWRPTGPMYLVAEHPQWGSVTPFALTSADEFRAPPPPALTSAEYAAAEEQVRLVGGETSALRTADQTQQAQFWADGGGSYTPPGHWNLIAQQIATAQGASLTANARMMAQLNVALADAAIACWDTKYTYDFWRPVTAINNADLDGNAGTQVDAAWRPLLITPPHPDYVSGHSTFSAAAAGILAATFGENTAFSTISVTVPGVTRSFTSFTQAAQEAGMSRIYAGIHTIFANNEGAVIGTKVANAVLAKFALTEDEQAPNVVMADSAANTRANLTLTGQVLDNLSGVASAQYRIDNGALTNMTLGADGGFSITTAFALDGSQDGAHTVTLIARDQAGNISAGYTRSFTLDTRVPTVALSSLAEGAQIDATSRVAGTVDVTGSGVAALSYSIDGGNVRTLSFDPATGTFDEALVLGDLSIGTHQLSLVAQDAAGNTHTLTRALSLPELAAFSVTKVTPTDGSGDIGSTYRPQVFFSRAVNAATLTADTLYATGPDGAKLAMTIVPALDGSFAWLLPDAPMPGGSRITLHLNGSAIRAAQDGAFLDADGNGTAGGELTWSFTTVSTTGVLGTKLVGKVVDPGADLKPMTFDDIRRGPDGVIHTTDDVFLNPIAHAKVWVIGQEDRFVYTDAAGNFELDSVPTGNVKVAIDGRTATNAPAGVFFPEMVMDATMRPGISNTLMGSMGTLETQAENAARNEVYLPRVQTSSLQAVSDTVPTTITVNPESAADLTDVQRSALTLTVQPGAAIGFDGQPVENLQIGISTVPPELVKDMLPPGVLQHTFDITIQAPGVDTFAAPVQITFPNVFNAAPGTKLNILSFDHTTGRLVINGTGTVSADGKTVASDEGSGVMAPGWHGMVPPGTTPDNDPPQCPADPSVPNPATDPAAINVVEPTLVGNSPSPAQLNAFVISPPAGGHVKTVTVTVDPELAKVLEADTGIFGGDIPINGGSWTLDSSAGSLSFDWDGKSQSALKAAGLLDEFAVYGGVVTVREVTVTSDGDMPPEGDCPDLTQITPEIVIHKIFIYRYLNPVYAAQGWFVNLLSLGAVDADELPFPDAVETGTGHSTQVQNLALHISADAAVTPSVAIGESFSNSGGTVFFSPVSARTYEDTLELRAGVELALEGTGTHQQKLSFDRAALVTMLADIRDHTPAYGISAALRTALADPGAMADVIMQRASAYYTGTVGDAVDISTGSASAGASLSLYFLQDAARPGLSGDSGSPWGTSIDGLSDILNVVAAGGSVSDVVKQFLLPDAINPARNGAATTFPLALSLWGSSSTADAFEWAVARTIAHELGHTLGLTHIQGGAGAAYNITGSATPDVMAYDNWSAAGAGFSTALDALKLGLDQTVTAAGVTNALNYYAFARSSGAAGALTPDGHFDISDIPVLNGKVPLVVDLGTGQFVSSIDFGVLDVADGPQTRQLRIVNLGNEAVPLATVSVSGSNAYSTQLPVGFAGSLAPGQARDITVTFNPALGRTNATMTIETGAIPLSVSLSGRGTAAGPALVVDLSHNNLGGSRIGSSVVRSDAIVLRNEGQQALVIDAAAIVEGGTNFSLVGLPANLATQPITIAPGASYTLGVKFAPSTLDLLRGSIQLHTNDSARPTVRVGVTGTGANATTVGQWGSDYVAIAFPNQGSGSTIRVQSDSTGRFEAVLPTEVEFAITVFDPLTGMVAHGQGVTGRAGTLTDLTSALMFRASKAQDSDEDGLPDDIEFAIGTSQGSRDTDRDGLDDFTEIQQGLDPLGGLNIPVGIVVATNLNGTAEAVATIGSTNGNGTATAVVATGSYGLAIVDAADITRPRTLAQLDLTGINVDVAVDTLRGVAAVAGSDAGLHLVDIANPSAPSLLQTIAFDAPVTNVVVRDGIAYATYGARIAAVDLNTGDIRQTLDLASVGSGTLTHIAVDANTLYTMDANRTLRTITVSGDVLTPRDSLVLASAGGKLFVGGGVAYVGTTTDFTQGISTVNVADPANITLLSGIDAANVAGQSLAATGSGLLVTAGNLRGPQGQQIYAVDVMNAVDPANTGAFLTRINLPAAPKDLALANGLAFVADGSGGLQIVNYAAFDTGGIAPTVSIRAEAIDVDSTKPGIQVLEGRAVRIVPTVTDDVQVRNVELLVNGQVVSVDPAFPFELNALAPTVASGGTTMALQVRATDTGGNSTLSNTVMLDVVRDTFAPQVQSVSVEEGARRFFVRSIDIQFDEPLDVSRLSTSGVHLVRAGTDSAFGTADDVDVAVRLDTRSFGQSLSVLVDGLLPPGSYRLTVDPAVVADRAGNALATPIVRQFSIRPASDVRAATGVPEIPTAPAANPGQQIGFAVPFDPVTGRATFATADANGTQATTTVNAVRWDAARGVAYFTVPLNAATGNVVVYGQVGTVRTDFADGTLPLQIVPVVTDVQVQSVSGDGSSAVIVLSGLGFTEGLGTEYRIGSELVADASLTTGPDVQGRSDAVLGFVVNGQVTLTVPLSNGVFGAISARTAGGTSASYSVNLASITSVALSGTPANAAQASANAGQAIVLNGSGLSVQTDVLLRYTNYQGSLAMVRLNPSAAASDGTSATLVLPANLNGAFALQVFGSASQPLLQIVPTLFAVSENGHLALQGSGFVEGGSTVNLPGASVVDTVVNAGVDVTYGYDRYGTYAENNLLNIDTATLSRFGQGSATVTTAGGTSAALALNVLRPGSDAVATGYLGDIAVDKTSGATWVLDNGTPGHLLRVNTATGVIAQSIELTTAMGAYNVTYGYAGLQINPSAFSLGGVSVPAGSLVLFNGYGRNHVTALNQSTGAIVAQLDLAGSYMTSGVFDAATGRIFATTNDNKLSEFNAATGVLVQSFDLPINVTTHTGMAIDPASGNLWIGSYYSGSTVVLVNRQGVEQRRVDLAGQGVGSNEISGLAFAADGSLRVSSTQGTVHQVTLAPDVAVRAATLTGITALATDGVATQAAVASANVGQLVVLSGTNFNVGTRVLFEVRSAEGTTSQVSITPLAINDAGTRLQVLVPDLATTGNVRVVNRGTSNLGGASGTTDSVYRNVTLSFTAGASTAAVRFADGGLEGVGNESWGIDNVRVARGATTVFSDDFEGAANSAWSEHTVEQADAGTLTRYAGRYSNESQTLNLAGLAAGQTYTLSFDLYVLDNWDGNQPTYGPDLIDVSVDGQSLMRESFANGEFVGNNTLSVQSFGASAPVRLQIVPTLTGISGRAGEDSQFTLSGSGFMEGASTLRIGGVAISDGAGNQNAFDVSGAKNGTLIAVAPRTLDGPIRISTEGGYAQITQPFASQPVVQFSAIVASANAGLIADTSKPSANTGQSIVLQGQGFTSQTLVQFQGRDDTGAIGTLTRSGSVSNGGTTLTVTVPALAMSGNVTVLGSSTSMALQVVPSLRAVGGTVVAGNTIVLEGMGLSAPDLVITVGGRTVGAATLRTAVDGTGTTLDQQFITVVVPTGIVGTAVTVATAGGTATVRSGVVFTTLATQTPTADPSDTQANAANLGAPRDARLTVNAIVGDGAAGQRDVDLYTIGLDARNVLRLNMGTATYGVLRVFDAAGTQVATRNFTPNDTGLLEFTSTTGGTYTIGVSGWGNTSYNLATAGSGTASQYTGAYGLNVSVQRGGSNQLSAIEATAGSGTAATAAVPSANTGQSVVLRGAGFVAGERVVFTTIDANGNLAELVVTPTTVDTTAQTITVTVPDAATTGRVRLERDRTGLVLQIVPTLSDVAMNVNQTFTGSTLTLAGTGFAEGASTVLFGNQRVDDPARNVGLDVYNRSGANSGLNLQVPDNVPTGPIRVVTVGGTSAAFGLSLASITGTAGSGTPATAGQASAQPGGIVSLIGVGLDASTDVVFQTISSTGQVSDLIVRPTTVNAAGTLAQVVVPYNAVTGRVRVVGDVNGSSVMLQIVPRITDVQVQSVAGDGSSAVVVLSGFGFLEGNGSQYRFGTESILDAGLNTGPDVSDRSDAVLGFVVNGQVTLTVPLSSGAFGAISVRTSGGTSASYSVNLASITSVALSGTPANAAQASANAGQAIVLNGSGLSVQTDVLLRYTNYQGSLAMVRLNPSAAASDGTSATLVLPANLNGAFALQVFGSASQPLLQIVPTLFAVSENGHLALQGSGFVEGGSTVNLPGASVVDTVVNAGVDVTYGYDRYGTYAENNLLNIDTATLSRFGQGSATVTTAGGTSAALALNVLRPGSDAVATGYLGDIAVDKTSGATWVLDNGTPGHLLRVNTATGVIAQSIELTTAMGAYNVTYGYAGLQINPSAFSLGGVSVPAGSLVLFNGYGRNHVTALNQSTGAIVAQLDLAGSYMTSGVFDAATGRIFATTNDNKLSEFNAATGVLVQSFDLPINVTTHTGMAIDPASGNLWIGSYYSGSTVVLVNRQGVEQRRVDLAGQGVGSNEISGLAFAADGSLRVSSTQGTVHQVTLAPDVAVRAATLTGITALATDGVATQAAVASANVGQLVVLSGTNFNVGTRVLFEVRSAEGTTSQVSITPLAINDAGTRLQVLVPDLATTGNVRVVNRGTSNLGGASGTTDSVYRNVTLSFTAGASTAAVRFADGGLEGVGNESWGIDNVRVARGATTVFSDDFEGAANSAWSEHTVEQADAGTLTRYAGRYSNESQTLNLAGLAAGQTYTLSFDLYVLDNWDGNQPTYGPDLIDVSVDGQSLMRESFANGEFVGNNALSVQSFGASAPVRLQIVPTLTGISGRAGEDSQFTLSGSGFMEGASTLRIGGVAISDGAGNQNAFDVSGAKNGTLTAVAPRTLDGPIRISTEGGYAQIDPLPTAQPLTLFTAMVAGATYGVAANAALPSANTAQSIVLQGQGFTSQTLVQFQGRDDTGTIGTLTRTGSVSNGGTTLTVTVPALATTGNVTVLGSGTSIALQVVPVLAAMGGSVTAGGTMVLDGFGLSAADLSITVGGQAVTSFSLRTVIDGSDASGDQQLITLVVPTGAVGAVVTVSSSGGSTTIRSGVVFTALGAQTPATEPSDTQTGAASLGAPRDARLTVNATVGDGAQGQRDVDLYTINLDVRNVLRLNMGTATYGALRVFDAAGTQVATRNFTPNDTGLLEFAAPATGTYTIGVSGWGNTSYNPATSGSGTASTYTGAYSVSVEVQRGGSSRLSSIQATASNGTPAQASVASANTGQSITLRGAGFVVGDRVIFLTLDTNGNVGEATIVPTSVDTAAQTITVTVPDAATTGRVRLERDRTGLVLQIVPTLVDVAMTANQGFAGSTLTLAGSGFAEGASTVEFGSQRVDDSSRGLGLDVYNRTVANSGLNLQVPDNVPTGPIRVVTVGGTSAAFGLSLSGITASAGSGTPTNSGQASALPGDSITLAGVGLDASTDVVFQVIDASGTVGDVVVRPSSVNAGGTQAQVRVPYNAVTGQVRAAGDANGARFALQIVPRITDVQVQSVSSDGSTATLVLSGFGFVEGGNSRYNFGTESVFDAGISTGAQVTGRYDTPLALNIVNGQVTLTVPLSAGMFGAISVRTAGGVSAGYSVNLASIQSVAQSGTQANAAQASANAGQSIELRGAGLSTATDVLLRYTNINGSLSMVRLSPSTAASDGTSATLTLPLYVNGAFALQVFGSASQPLLQIVPTLFAISESGYLVLQGSGFVEGASTITLPGKTVADTVVNAGVDVAYGYDQGTTVYNENLLANVPLADTPRYGQGSVSITTAGGTSAALALNVLRPGSDTAAAGYLTDVAVDKTSGATWVLDNDNPDRLLRIDTATGAIAQTITLTTAMGPYATTQGYAGLQINPSAFSLGGVSVPAGSLVLFNGYGRNHVTALNPSTGAIVAQLDLAGSYMTSGVLDAATGRIFATTNDNKLSEFNAATGALVQSFAVPINVTGHTGMAIDPTTGNLWIGSQGSGTAIVLVNRQGVEQRRVDLAGQGVGSNEISGLAFAADGSLRVSSTQGTVHFVTLS